MKLLIPDIHNKIYILDKILKKYSFIPNKISLGDWHDSHGPYEKENLASETARAQRDFIENPNNICLFGNHDMPYAFPDYKGDGLYCSGHSFYTQKFIDKYMTREMWDKVRLFVWLNINNKPWLISHAGFHPYFAPITEKHVTDLCDNALNAITSNSIFPEILMAGRKRGGPHPCGGCTWLDFREFVPITGINQIVGHTIAFDVREKTIEDSENYCIDCQLSCVAILDDDGKVIIEKM